MMQQDLFGNDEVRARMAVEKKHAARMEAENRKRQYGTDPKKLARRESPDTSKAAAGGVDTTALEAKVHRAIASYGQHGCIASNLLEGRFKGLPYSSVTARFKALVDKGFITAGPDKRPGTSGRMQRVMRSVVDPQ